MKTTDNSSQEAFRRASAWVGAHQEAMNANPAVPELFESLHTVIEQLSAASVDQEQQRVGLLERSARISRLRKELWSYHMLPIMNIARNAATAAPELLADVRMPRSRGNERLLDTASAMAKGAEARKDLFVQHGLAPDFIEQLNSIIALLRQVIDRRGTTRAERVGATTATGAIVREGKRVLRLLDNVFQIAFRGSEMLNEWSAARHIQTRRARAAKPNATVGTRETANRTPETIPVTAQPALATVA